VRPKRTKVESDARLGAFSCKSLFCTKLHYRTAGGANRHMLGERAEEALPPYCDERKSKRAPKDASMAAPSGQIAQASSLSSMPAAAQAESVPPEIAPVLRSNVRGRAGRSLHDSGSCTCESSSGASESEDSIDVSSDESEAESRRAR